MRNVPIMLGVWVAVLAAFTGPTAAAGEKISDGVVRIGVMTDMSSVFSDMSGSGPVLAAKMAVEDFGGKVLGMPI